VNEEDKIIQVNPKTLIPNKKKLDIYHAPTKYDEIKLNILEHGILEPLLVNKDTNVIISGNLRLQIALELNMSEVPVIFKEVNEKEKEMDMKSVSTNKQRIKSYYDILKEIEFFEEHYKIKKGQRTDLNPELKEINKPSQNTRICLEPIPVGLW